MALWNRKYPIDTSPGGDTVKDGFEKIINEVGEIYNKLNQLRIVRAGTTPPNDAEVNELWLDTSTNPPILKRFDGTNWVDAVVGVAKDDLSNVADSVLLDKLKNVDGTGSGLDADLIRGNPPVFTKFFDSGLIYCTFGSNPTYITISHGLGVTPIFAFAVAECISDNNSYTTGQRILLSSADDTSGNLWGNLVVDSQNIYYIQSNVRVRAPSTGSVFVLSSAYWRLRIFAFA